MQKYIENNVGADDPVRPERIGEKMNKVSSLIIKIFIITIIIGISIFTIPSKNVCHGPTEAARMVGKWYYPDSSYGIINLTCFCGDECDANISNISISIAIPDYIIMSILIIATVKTNKGRSILIIFLLIIVTIIAMIGMLLLADINAIRGDIKNIRTNSDDIYDYIKLEDSESEMYLGKIKKQGLEENGFQKDIKYAEIIKIINDKKYQYAYAEIKEKEDFFELTIDKKTYRIEKQILE